VKKIMQKDDPETNRVIKSKTSKSSSVFETLLDENFFVTVKDKPLPEVKTLKKSDWLYICLSMERNKLIKFWCELWDHYIFLRQDKDKPVTAYMDVNYARIKIIIDDKIAGKNVSCIKFSKFRSYEELFHNDINTMVAWF
jgi:hypothetical protein